VTDAAPASTGGIRTPGSRSWPRTMWLAHLVLPLLGLAFVVASARAGGARGGVFLAVLTGSLFWLGGGIGVLLVPAGRRLLDARRREIALLLGTGVGLLILGDALLTLTGAVPTYETLASRYALHYRPAVFTQGRLEPGQDLDLPDHPRIEINAEGFRGPAIVTPKPAGTTRVMFLGGSQVFDQNGDNWPLDVVARLDDPAIPVDGINAAVPGHRTLDSVGKLLTGAWMLEPDLIVLCQGWNDVKYFNRIGPGRSYRDVFAPRPTDWRVEPRGLERALGVSAVYRLARTRVVNLRVGAEGERWRASAGDTMSDAGLAQYRLAVATVCDLGRSLGATVVLCTQPRLPVAASPDSIRARIGYDYVGLDHAGLVAAFEATDRILREVAAEKNVHLLDLHAVLSGRPELFDDHVHFTRDGSRAVAEVVADALRPIIENRTGRREAS